MPGGSWKTGIAGWAAVVADIAGLIAMTIEKQGLPKDASTWIVFGSVLAAGVGNILSKDYDKTNSSHPVAVSQTVPEAVPAAVPASQ